jgi:hypothetical protein
VQKAKWEVRLAALRDQVVAGDYEKARYMNDNPIEAALRCVGSHLDAKRHVVTFRHRRLLLVFAFCRADPFMSTGIKLCKSMEVMLLR